MTTEELDAIEARANAATPGPWVAWTGHETPDAPYWVDTADRLQAINCCGYDGEMREPDAKFVAAARADVPALVADLRNARRALLMLREWWIDHYGDLGKYVRHDEPTYAEDIFALGLGETKR